jgi:hypothetical protein
MHTFAYKLISYVASRTLATEIQDDEMLQGNATKMENAPVYMNTSSALIVMRINIIYQFILQVKQGTMVKRRMTCVFDFKTKGFTFKRGEVMEIEKELVQ